MIYLNFAALCPTRSEADQEVQRTLTEFKHYLYSEAGIRWYLHLVEECRVKVAKLLNVQNSHSIAFVPNASTANHCALSFLPWEKGDVLVTTTHENPSIVREMQTLERRGIRLYLISPNSLHDLMTSIENIVTSEPVRAILVSHVSHVDGRIFPISEIAEIANALNCMLLVDGAQAVGHIPVDLQEYTCDLYFFTGHKWCQGPLGTGALVMNQRFLERNPEFATEPLHQGKAPAGRFEIGTHNIGLIAGLAKACELKWLEGLREHERQEIKLTIKRQLEKLQRVTIKEWEGPHAPGMLSFHYEDHQGLFDFLQNKWNISVKQFLDYPAGETPLIRMSWIGKENQGDIHFALEKIHKWAWECR